MPFVICASVHKVLTSVMLSSSFAVFLRKCVAELSVRLLWHVYRSLLSCIQISLILYVGVVCHMCGCYTRCRQRRCFLVSLRYVCANVLPSSLFICLAAFVSVHFFGMYVGLFVRACRCRLSYLWVFTKDSSEQSFQPSN